MTTTDSIDLGELSGDNVLRQKLLDFKTDFEKASGAIFSILEKLDYDHLSTEDKVRYNLFMAFAIDSFYWMYLRVKGIDPNQHEIKEQINRVREYMKKSKEIYEKNTLMPRVDQDAAKRFVRGALWTPQQSDSNPEPSGSSPPDEEKTETE